MTLHTRLYANNARTTLSSPLGASDTTIYLSSGAKFPSPLVGEESFLLTVDNGIAVEVIEIGAKSGNVLTVLNRGLEGTVAQVFSSGSRVECRTTKGILESFARLEDRLASISSVDLLPTPAGANNSYVCDTTDEVGNPIIAIRSYNFWTFPTHPHIKVTGSAASNGTTTTLPLSAASTLLTNSSIGSYVVQFFDGVNAAQCRRITGISTNEVSWSTPLPTAVGISNQFTIYQSVTSAHTELTSASDDSFVYSLIFSE